MIQQALGHTSVTPFGIGSYGQGRHRRCMEYRLLVELEQQYYELKVQVGYDASYQSQLFSLNKSFPVDRHSDGQEKNVKNNSRRKERQAGAHTHHLNEVSAAQQGELTHRANWN
jgi:hypothetical protein